MAVILLYHRVSNDTASDPWGLTVSVTHFAQHMDALRRYATPVSLTELLSAADQKAGRARVAVTFDDGYADNLEVAMPLLETHEIPATFFLSTAALDSDREFWWDELARVLLGPGTLPSVYRDRAGGRFELAESRIYSEQDASRHSEWKAWEKVPTARHELFLRLWAECQVLDANLQSEFVADVIHWAGTAALVRPTHRVLSCGEAVELMASPLASIGAHTKHHLRLSACSAEVQRSEIVGSKRRLEEMGARVEHLAYPYGGPSDFTAETVSLVRSAGFVAACTSSAGLLCRSDPLQLPRLFVMDCAGESLIGRIHSLLS
jgi:peptidoglycan/xylan/chitin deacetylase (PgdA/CDA1 family)